MRRRIRACLLRCAPSGSSTYCRVRIRKFELSLHQRPSAPPRYKTPREVRASRSWAHYSAIEIFDGHRFITDNVFRLPSGNCVLDSRSPEPVSFSTLRLKRAFGKGRWILPRDQFNAAIQTEFSVSTWTREQSPPRSLMFMCGITFWGGAASASTCCIRLPLHKPGPQTRKIR